MKTSKIITFALLFQISCVCLGQSSVTYYDNIVGSNSVIREYSDNHSIIYIHRSGDWGYFIYDSYGTGNNVSNAIKVDSLCRVYDFRIMDDTVYFCGKKGGYLMFGCFGVSEFNNSTALLKTWFFDGTGMDSLMACKMDVYRETGLAHIAAVGQYKDLATSMNYSAIYEFIEVGPINSVCSIYLTDDKKIQFTDITVTDNYVVAASNNSSSNICLLHPFDITNNFISSSLLPGNAISINDVTPYGKIMIEKYNKDSILIANHFSVSNIVGTTLKLLLVQNSYPFIMLSKSLLMPHTGFSVISSKWNMRELSVNRNNMSAAILQDAETPFHSEAESTIFEYDINNWSTMNILASWKENTTFYSIHRRNGDAFQTIGYEVLYDPLNNPYYHIPIYRKTFGFAPTCTHFYTPIAYYPNNPTVSEYAIKDNVKKLNFLFHIIYNAPVISLNINEECIEQ